LLKGGGDVAVVDDIFVGEGCALPVLEPLVHNLVPAYLITPYLFFNTLKVLGAIDVDPLFLLLVHRFFNPAVSLSLKLCAGACRFRRSISPLLSEFAYLQKECMVFREGDAGEVYLQELCVFLAVGVGIKDAVDVVENLFR